MKNLIYLLSVISLAGILFSCTESMKENVTDNSMLKKGLAIGESTPVSDNGVIPRIIPGENRGGNRTCKEVAEAFSTTFDLCGDKIDYNFDDDGNGYWDGEFPEGINVSVDGIYVSFEADGCFKIADSYFKVGAVIVKGANAANVYYYPEGTLADGGLAAPGDKFMVSNLTFCFVECEETLPLFIAVKARYTAGSEGDYYLDAGTRASAASDGEFIFTDGGCKWVGVNEYSGSSDIILRDYFYRSDEVGVINITESANSLTVTVTMKGNGELFETRFFVGTMAEFLSTVPEGDGCPDYWNSPLWHIDYTEANSVSYTVYY